MLYASKRDSLKLPLSASSDYAGGKALRVSTLDPAGFRNAAIFKIRSSGKRAMMDFLKGPWGGTLLVLAVVVAIALIWFAVRRANARKRGVPPPTPAAPQPPHDPANLDSSHIGGPLLEITRDPNFRS